MPVDAVAERSHLFHVMRCFAMLLMSAMVAGCAPATMTEARISDRFTARQIEEVLAGVDMWCEAGVACLQKRVVSHVNANIVPYYNPKHYGSLHHINGRPQIGINAEELAADGRSLTSTTAHEIGHAVSGREGHPDCHDCVMSPTRYWEKITDQDIAWVLGDPVD